MEQRTWGVLEQFRLKNIMALLSFVIVLITNYLHQPMNCSELQLSTSFSPVYRSVNLTLQKLFVDTESFYTSNEGYQFIVRVYPNGCDNVYGHVGLHLHHLSAYIILIEGKNDDSNTFPVNGVAEILVIDKNYDEVSAEMLVQFEDSILPTTNNCTDVSKPRYREKCKCNVQHGKTDFIPRSTLESGGMIENDGTVCLKISFDQFKHQVPIWNYDVDEAMLNSLHTQSLPFYFTLVKYSEFKRTNTKWKSRPFYCKKGYKLQIIVHANGIEEFMGKYLSLIVVLLKGENDKHLAFPFNAIIEVRLLNWAQNFSHEKFRILHYKADIVCRRQVLSGYRDTAPCGFAQHLPHHRLENKDDPDNFQFIKNDTLCFEVVNVTII